MLHLKQKARQRELSFGTFLFEFFEVGVPMMVKQAEGEFLVLDMEHTGAGLDKLKPIILQCRSLGIVPIVRVPDSQYHHIAGALDVGAQGIMVPMVETADQMKTIIQYAKYYPVGARGCAFGMAHDDYSSGEIALKMEQLNNQVMLIPLIESRLGAENAAEIAALDEVDLLWIGHLDLSQSLAIPEEFSHPKFQEALKQICEGAAQGGKACGIVIAEPEEWAKWYDRGVRFISYSADLWLFQRTLQKGIAAMKEAASAKLAHKSAT